MVGVLKSKEIDESDVPTVPIINNKLSEGLEIEPVAESVPVVSPVEAIPIFWFFIDPKIGFPDVQPDIRIIETEPAPEEKLPVTV